MQPSIEQWYVGSLDHLRAAEADDIIDHLKTSGAKLCYNFKSVCLAMERAKETAKELGVDEIVVFGSFFTVSDALKYLVTKEIGGAL